MRVGKILTPVCSNTHGRLTKVDPIAHIRIGMNGKAVVANRNAVEIGIVDDIGTMGEFGALYDCQRVKVHPDTGFDFAGQVIPGFQAAKRLCEQLHDKIPHLKHFALDLNL